MSDNGKKKYLWFIFGCLFGSLATIGICHFLQPLDGFTWLSSLLNNSKSANDQPSGSSNLASCSLLSRSLPPWPTIEKQITCRSNQTDIPVKMVKRIQFWKQVWGEIPDRQYLLVDGRKPWIIYKWVDCRDLFRFGKADAEKEAICDSRLLAEKKQLIRRLKRPKPNRRLLKLYDHNRRQAVTAHRHLQVVQGRKNSLRASIGPYSKFALEVESIFHNLGVSPCLARVSIIESLADPAAVSPAGALGAFQFVDATARKYLMITDLVDERLDPLRAGWAAARYLKKLNKIFKSWPLALTAYNTGPTRLRRLIRKRKTNNLTILVNRGNSGSFGFQGQNYFAQFMAVIDLTIDETFSPPQDNITSFLRLPEAISLTQLANCLRSTKKMIAQANPALGETIVDQEELIPKDYLVNIPKEVLLSCLDNLSSL